MRFPPVSNRSVLVTGCSSGIGEAAARLLAERGWKVIPTARRRDDIERLRRLGFEPVELDLASSESVRQAAAQVMELTRASVGGIVNNAGYGQPGAVEDLDRDMLRRQFEVNLFGLVEFTNCFIPVFRRQGYGRIVNISSLVGRISLPFMGAYSATKFALEAISDAWRVELQAAGIAVSIIEPGPIATRFGDNALRHLWPLLEKAESPFHSFYREYARQRESRVRGNLFRLPPEAVARRIIHALESTRPKTRYPVTIPAVLAGWLRRLLPDRVLDRLVIRHWRRELALRGAAQSTSGGRRRSA